MNPLIVPAALTAMGALGAHYGKPNPSRTEQLPLQDPQQQQWASQLGQMGMQGLQDPSAGFAPIAAQARQQLQSKTLPSIAERFGGFGGTRSSAFNAAMTGAGQGLESDLAAQQAQYGLANRNSLMNLMQMGMGRRFENMYQPETPGMMQQLGSSLMGTGLGGMGEMMGAQFSSDLQGARTSKAIKEWQAAQNPQQKTNYSPITYSGGLGYSGGR